MFHPGNVASCVTGVSTGAIDDDGWDECGGVFGGVVDEVVEGEGVFGGRCAGEGDDVAERRGKWTGDCAAECGGRGESVGDGVTDGRGE